MSQNYPSRQSSDNFPVLPDNECGLEAENRRLCRHGTLFCLTGAFQNTYNVLLLMTFHIVDP